MAIADERLGFETDRNRGTGQGKSEGHVVTRCNTWIEPAELGEQLAMKAAVRAAENLGK